MDVEDKKNPTKLHIMIVFFTLYVNMIKAITTTIFLRDVFCFKTNSAALTESRYSVDYKLLRVSSVLKNIEGYRVSLD